MTVSVSVPAVEGSQKPVLVSPAEHHPLLRALGESSPIVESYGVDFLFLDGKGLCGVQRKEVNDFVASLRGDRLSRELYQKDQLNHCILLIEGAFPWEFGWQGQFPRWGRTFGKKQWEGLELSIQIAEEMTLVRTASIEDTALRLPRIEAWLAHADHSSLRRIPKAKHSSPVVRLLQGLDGVSAKKAESIAASWPLPLQFTFTKEDLVAQPGWGKVSAERLEKVIPFASNGEST